MRLPLLILLFPTLALAALDVREEPLPLPPDTKPHQLSLSPDGQRLAYIQKSGWKLSAIVDGVEHPRCDWIVNGQILFTDDNRHSIYQAKDRRKTCLVIDGIPQKPYDSITSWLASPTGDVLYAAQTGTQSIAAIGASESKPYPSVRLGAIAPGGKSAAFIAATNQGERAIFNGHEGKLYPFITDLQLSPDGKRLAYRAQADRQWRMVIDGQENAPFENLSPPAFSPDSRRAAYAAVRAGRYVFVVDGAESAPEDQAELQPPTFSPDSQHIAWIAGPREAVRVLLDRRPSKPYAAIHPALHFSPDSKRLAFAAQKPTGKWALVVDETATGDYDAIHHIRFSPDSRRVAAIVAQNGKSLLITDGLHSRPFDSLHHASLNFTPDSQHLAAVATLAGKNLLLLDALESPPYDTLFPGRPLRFDSPTTLTILAIQKGQLLKLHISLPEK